MATPHSTAPSRWLLLAACALLAPRPAWAEPAPEPPAAQAQPAAQGVVAPGTSLPEPPLGLEVATTPEQGLPQEEEERAAPESLSWTLARMLLTLGAVMALIYLTLNVGLRRLMGLQGAALGNQPIVAVVERVPLDQRRTLLVLKAANEYLLVGSGESGLQLLSKLDAEAVERIRSQRPQSNEVVPLSPFLQKLMSRRGSSPPSA
jgi:flagellar protein FliO/FliZ